MLFQINLGISRMLVHSGIYFNRNSCFKQLFRTMLKLIITTEVTKYFCLRHVHSKMFVHILRAALNDALQRGVTSHAAASIFFTTRIELSSFRLALRIKHLCK